MPLRGYSTANGGWVKVRGPKVAGATRERACVRTIALAAAEDHIPEGYIRQLSRAAVAAVKAERVSGPRRVRAEADRPGTVGRHGRLPV